MSSLPKRLPKGSPADSSLSRIEAYYTQAILSGQLKEGDRLPPSDEIARIWSASGTIVQKAMKRLVAAGLVERARRSGTIVRARQERAVVGVIFGSDIAEVTAGPQRLLVRHLEAAFRERHLMVRVYDCANLTEKKEREQSLQMLRSDLVFYAFKGVITVQAEVPDGLLPANLPRFDISAFDRHAEEEAGCFAGETLRFLDGRKRKRILLSTTSRGVPLQRFILREAFETAQDAYPGMEMKVHVIHPDRSGYSFEKTAFEAFLKLAERWQSGVENLPDAIIMTDAVAARGACMALLKSGIESSEKLDIVVRATAAAGHFYGMPVFLYNRLIDQYAREVADALWKRMIGDASGLDKAVFAKGEIIPY